MIDSKIYNLMVICRMDSLGTWCRTVAYRALAWLDELEDRVANESLEFDLCLVGPCHGQKTQEASSVDQPSTECFFIL